MATFNEDHMLDRQRADAIRATLHPLLQDVTDLLTQAWFDGYDVTFNVSLNAVARRYEYSMRVVRELPPLPPSGNS